MLHDVIRALIRGGRIVALMDGSAYLAYASVCSGIVHWHRGPDIPPEMWREIKEFPEIVRIDPVGACFLEFQIGRGIPIWRLHALLEKPRDA